MTPTCTTGKHPYRFYTTAQFAARWMRRRYHERFDVYRCPTCRTFHVGGCEGRGKR